MPIIVKRRIGIVGSEGIKFTGHTEQLARQAIRRLVARASVVISGGCHLGGIDLWAKEEADAMGVKCIEHLPKQLSWEKGYKPRNLLIANGSDEVVCITVKNLPKHYKGMRFDLCYHCNTKDHVKSGGCWTVKQAIAMGKIGKVVVING